MSGMCSETVQRGRGARWDGCRRNKTCPMLMIVEVFIISFNKYFLHNNNVSGTVLDAGATVRNWIDMVLAFTELLV